MKFLKTIRFDGSDEFVFDNAAETGSWAIPGGFMFTGQEPDSLSRQTPPGLSQRVYGDRGSCLVDFCHRR